MIAFRDFAPQVVEQGGFLKWTKYEDFADIVERVNTWIDEQSVQVMNIETIQLPEERAWCTSRTGTTTTYYPVAESPRMRQIVRVWYRG